MTVRPLHPKGYVEELDRLAAEELSASDPADGLPSAIRALDAPPQKPLRWIVDGLWPAALLGLIVGDGGAFKSSAALHVAGAIAGGYPVFDRYPTVRRPAMVVSAEDEMDVVLMRLEAFIQGHQWVRERVMENVHIIASDEASLGQPAWLAHIKREAERIEPGFIVVDPWAELLGGDENSNTDARPAIKYLRRLGKHVDAAIAVVHHAGKAAEGRRQLDRIRGASALPSASRVILFFEFQPDSVKVENLKMSRTPRLETFEIKREIHSLPENRAQWTSARLTIGAAQAFQLTKAEQFIIAQLQMAAPRKLTTGELRSIASECGVRNQDMSRGLTRLSAVGKVSYETGRQNSKHWFLISGPASPSRGNGAEPELELTPALGASGREQPDQSRLPSLPYGLNSKTVDFPSAQPALGPSGQAFGVPSSSAHPFRGGRQTNDSEPNSEPSGQTDLDEDDIQALIDEDLGKREDDS